MDRNFILLLLSFLVTFQMIFIGIFLISHKKGKRKNNILLGSIFLLMGWNIGDMVFGFGKFQVNLGIFEFIDDGFILLYGPLFYLYIQMAIYKDYQVTRKYLLHFLPYLLFTLMLVVPFILPGIKPVNLEELPRVPLYIQVISYGLYAHILIYLGFGFQSLKKYREIILHRFSKIDHINLNLLSFTLKALAAITFISLFHNSFVLAGDHYIYGVSIFLLLLFLIYFVNRVIIKALKQPEIFAGIEKNERTKYSGSNLTDEQVANYSEKLLRLVNDEKLYQDPQLNINDLADRLNISSKSLSQVINQSFNKNFFDFINSFRIQEAQNILKNATDEKLTVLEVMYQVGFNSKSSFNTAFRKITGQTPTQFRRR